MSVPPPVQAQSVQVQSAPTAPTRSSLSLPVSVSLPGLAAAASAKLPQTLATFEQDQPLVGGALGTVHLSGTVSRAGALLITPETGGLQVSLPVSASVKATGGVLNKTFTGSAKLLLHLSPQLNADWTTTLSVRAEHTWTDPMILELLGAKISLTPLIDPLVRGQLERLSATLQDSYAQATNLRPRAEALWARLSQPWPLPTPQPAYLAVTPEHLSVSPFRYTSQALTLTLQANFLARAGLGTLPQATPLSPALPPLQQRPETSAALQLALPVRLTPDQLSSLATQAAAEQSFKLPVFLNPTLQVSKVVVSVRGERLNAEVHVGIRALGLSVNATVDVSGRPVLEGSLLTLQDPLVHTRPNGLTGRVIGLLADGRAQSFVAQSARFDTAAALLKAREAVRAQLPFTLAPGVQLFGTLDHLALTGLHLDASGVTLSTQAVGALALNVQPDQLLAAP